MSVSEAMLFASAAVFHVVELFGYRAPPCNAHFSRRTERSTMKLAVLASLLAGAAAFAPTRVAKTSTSLNAFENELG